MGKCIYRENKTDISEISCDNCKNRETENCIRMFAEEKKPITRMNDFEHMVLSAERYALGRRTYIVSTVCGYIEEVLSELSEWCIGNLIKDIKDPLSGYYGDECDRREWLGLLEKLETEIEKR